MHELAICQALIRQVETIARQHAAIAIDAIHLQIGLLSGVEPDLLRRAYPLACAGTLAGAAELFIEQPPLKVRCRSCGARTTALPNRLLCGECGDWRTDVCSGDELLLKTVEFTT